MNPPDSVAGRDPSPVSLTLVAIVLAVVAGFIDAVSYLHVVSVFPANQSGNVAFLGLSIGGKSPAPGWAPPVAIAAFMVGAAVGRWSTGSSRTSWRSVSRPWAAATLLWSVAFIAATHVPARDRAPGGPRMSAVTGVRSGDC